MLLSSNAHGSPLRLPRCVPKEPFIMRNLRSRWPLRVRIFTPLALTALCTAAFCVLSCSAETSSEEPAGEIRSSLSPYQSILSASRNLKLSIWTLPDQPPTRGVIEAKIAISKASDNTPVNGLTISIVPWMPSMGHGTPISPSVTSLGQGEYIAKNVSVFMAGQWELRTTLTSLNGVNDSATFALDVQ